jgi:tetratricopeptide (TPR) repeat protein
MTDFIPHEAPAHNVKELPVAHPGRPVGRDDILSEIYARLQSGQSVLVHGAPGTGKTTLAAALAAAFSQRPDGVLWIADATHPVGALLVRVGRALAIQEVMTSERPADKIGAVSARMADTNVFIVLDNVTRTDAAEMFINRCVQNQPVLLLSDEALEGPWQTMPLEALSDMDALTLFKQKAGLKTDSHDIDIYGITKLLRYHPQAIVMAARAMVAAKQQPDTYFSNLKQVAEKTDDPVQGAITLSYRTLNNALQGLLLMLGATFRGEASLELLSMISNVPQATIKQATKVLSQLYLIEQFERYDSPYYRLHPLVHQFARTALEGRNQLDALQQKVHDGTLEYAQAHGAAGDVSHAHLAKEIDNFIAAAKWASENDSRETADTLVSALTRADNFVQSRGYVYELLQLRNYAAGSTSAFPAYGPESIPTAAEAGFSYADDVFEGEDEFEVAEEDLEEETPLVEEDSSVYEPADLGGINVSEGMRSDALRPDALEGIDVEQLRMALSQAKQQGDITRQIQILKAIGKVQVGQGNETEAITTYNEILDAYEGEDDEGTLDALDMLAALLVKTNNSQAAIMHATHGVQLADKLDDSAAQLRLLMSLGDARNDLGETDEAVEAYSTGLQIARQTGDRQHEALLLHCLGEAYLDNGQPDDAIHALDQARDLFKTQDKREYEGRVLSALGDANSDLERWSEAIGYYQSAVHIAREVDNQDEERLDLSKLAQAQEQSGKLPDALLSYRQALHLAYRSGQREEIVSAIVDLVRLLLNSKYHLAICELLLQDALTLEPDDRDVNQLKEQVDEKRAEADAQGIEQRPVGGTAQQYATNAYELLEG